MDHAIDQGRRTGNADLRVHDQYGAISTAYHLIIYAPIYGTLQYSNFEPVRSS